MTSSIGNELADSRQSKKIRVTIVSHWRNDGFAQQLYTALALTGRIDLQVVGPSSAAAGYDESPEVFNFVRVTLRDKSTYLNGFRFFPLCRAIKATRPDVILAMTEAFDVYLLQLALGRHLNLIQGLLLFYGFENLPVANGRKLRMLIRPLWKNVSGGATANSEVITSLRDAGFPASKPLELVPFGVPQPLVKHDSCKRDQLRYEFGISSGFAIGYVGRLIAAKGVTDLVHALKRLPASASLFFLGTGELFEAIRSESKMLGLDGRVHLLGEMHHDRVQDFLAAIDVLVLPSRTTQHWKEQLGRVIPEAMLAGTPVIGSSSGAIPEVIGDAGIVFPEGDIQKLADALMSLITNDALRSDLSARGLSRAMQNYTVDAMAGRLLKLIEQVLALPATV